MAKKKVENEMPQTLEAQKPEVDNNKKTAEIVAERVKKELAKLEDKSFNVWFYVIDTKGVPSGSLLYIYKLAYELRELGYNASLLYSERDFVGVSGWAEKKYADLPHHKVESTNTRTLLDGKPFVVAPSDFLIIPEIYTDIISQTRNLPCKRIILFQNDEYFTRFIPLGVNPYEYKVTDAIVNTENAEAWVKENLPLMKTHIITPSVSSTLFRKPEKPRKLIVNIVAKDGNDASRILKPFMWKYPKFKWVTFTSLGNLPQNMFADALREGIATIWIDEDCSFGYTPLEALKTGSIVIGKIPHKLADWMKNGEEGLTDSVIWFDDYSSVPDLIAQIVSMYLKDEMPEEVYTAIEGVKDEHTKDKMVEDIKKVFVDGFFTERKEGFQEVLDNMNKEEEAK